MSAPTSSRPAIAPEAERSRPEQFSAKSGTAHGLAAEPIAPPRELPTWQPKNAARPSRRAKLLNRVEAYARQQLASLSAIYTYHSLEHTEQVVNNANVIADAEALAPELRDLLLICAWMHDVGVTKLYSGHEHVSFELTKELCADTLSSVELAVVEEAIMGTKIPQTAKHIVAQILCDADLLYLGTTSFTDWSGRLRREHTVVFDRSYTDAEWREINATFIRNHTYFTRFAREYCDAGCAYHLAALENR